jgi:hypothetical protein
MSASDALFGSRIVSSGVAVAGTLKKAKVKAKEKNID